MATDPTAPQALLINGTVGSGKTTTADLIGELLREREVPHAVIDLDWLRNAWPAPVNDPFHSRLALQNLGAVSANFRRAGARRFVLAGVLETDEDRRGHAAALGMPLTVVRLVVEPDVVLARLVKRHPVGEGRDWHLARSGELDAILSSAAVDDLVVEVEGMDAPEVAARTLAAAGWA